MSVEALAALRPVLDAALGRALDSLSTSHVVLLSQQLATEPSPAREAGLLCLLTAQSLGVKPEDAAAPAVALSLLGAMGRVFGQLDGAESPRARWGMPRALNAGDGFYALAQAALLQDAGSPAAEQRLAAIELLDAAARAYSDALRVALPDGSNVDASSLTGAALALGALYAGASRAQAEALAAGDFASLSAPARDTLSEATRFLATPA